MIQGSTYVDADVHVLLWWYTCTVMIRVKVCLLIQIELTPPPLSWIVKNMKKNRFPYIKLW